MYQNLSQAQIVQIAEQTAVLVIPLLQNFLSNMVFEKPLNNSEIRHIFKNSENKPVSDKTLSEWKKKYAMPFHRIGREVYYLPSELKQWFNAHKFPIKTALKEAFTVTPDKSQIRQELPTPKRKGGRK